MSWLWWFCKNNECFQGAIFYRGCEEISMLSVLSQSIFSSTKLSSGFCMALLTWSLSCGPLHQKEQVVEWWCSLRGEPFNLNTIKWGITIQRAALQSVHSNLFSHASLSSTFSLPSHFCLVVNTSITPRHPSRNSTFLNQSRDWGSFTLQPTTHPSDWAIMTPSVPLLKPVFIRHEDMTLWTTLYQVIWYIISFSCLKMFSCNCVATAVLTWYILSVVE